MGFIRNLLRNREKSQLEEALRKDPSPSVYVRLARMYQEEGDLAQAAQIAKRGAAKFPESAEMGSAEQDLVRLDRDAECKRLRERIDNYPNPRLYSRLAELLRADGKADEARSLIARGLRNYPTYGGLHYVLGLLANDEDDLEVASKHLKEATEDDTFNYAALKLLAEVCVKLERPAEAVEAYAKILAFAPDDEEIKDRRARLMVEEGIEESAKKQEPARKVSPSMDTKVMGTEEVAAGMAAEEAKQGAASASAGTKLMPTEEAEDSELAPAIRELTSGAGIEGAVLVDNYGLPVASSLPEGTEEALAAAMTTGIRRSASPACGEVGLGAFEEMVVESAGGSIYVYALREMTLAVFTKSSAKAGMVERKVHVFAEKALDLH
jgi:predicted regulator of Ras-like GTPase activity (Roadblock/LC7/MglB family)/thioredoxin-like negative regulator of GroEL